MRNEMLLDHLLELPSCSLIGTGRSGADFFQSLLDAHPEVLMFNGALFFYSFWDNSVCVKSGNFDVGDLLREFYGKHIELFKTRYDLIERKNQLGESFDQSLSVDSVEFEEIAIQLMGNRNPSSKNILLAIYAAYAICLGQDIGGKKLFFHHAHHFEALAPFLKDFPKSKIICMTRDPRANFVSSVEKLKVYFPSTDNEAHLYRSAKRILADATAMEAYDSEFKVIRVEDLDRKCVFDKLCDWLNISYDKCLERSTWGGKNWMGDCLSSKNIDGGRSRSILKNSWEEKLSFTDKYIFNFIFNSRLKRYGYDYKGVRSIDSILIPFLVWLPLSHEAKFFSLSYIRGILKNGEYEKLVKNIIYYFPRVFLFLRYSFNAIRGKSCTLPILKCEE
jgi:hypothetical protein